MRIGVKGKDGDSGLVVGRGKWRENDFGRYGSCFMEKCKSGKKNRKSQKGKSCYVLSLKWSRTDMKFL